jgi:GTPase Era involved in 16S rRNA processing
MATGHYKYTVLILLFIPNASLNNLHGMYVSYVTNIQTTTRYNIKMFYILSIQFMCFL